MPEITEYEMRNMERLATNEAVLALQRQIAGNSPNSAPATAVVNSTIITLSQALGNIGKVGVNPAQMQGPIYIGLTLTEASALITKLTVPKIL